MNALVAWGLYLGVQALRGEPIARALADVRATEFISADELRHIQAQRQLEQLRFVLDHVPFYVDAYKPFRQLIRSASSWAEVNKIVSELPILASDYVRSHKSCFIADNIREIRTHPDRTSGSSGTPLTFPCDQKAWAYRHALAFRNMEAYGVGLGEPYIYVYGLHWNRRTQLQLGIRDYLLNRVRVSAYKIGPTEIEEYFTAIVAKRPTHFLGYPQAIYELCQLFEQKELYLLDRIRLKAVFVTGEPLLDYQREVIERVLGAPCVNQYGSAEGGLCAVQCPEGGLHITSEVTWITAVRGEIQVTDTMLRAFPMIRYGIGDEAELDDATCPCGRPHPLITTIQGRSGEPITLPNGRTVNSHLPGYIFKPLSASGVIRRYRFVHHADQQLGLYLVVGPQFNGNHMQIIEEEVKKAFGEDVPFTMHVVDQIPHLPNAKHRSYVRVID